MAAASISGVDQKENLGPASCRSLTQEQTAALALPWPIPGVRGSHKEPTGQSDHFRAYWR